MRFVIQRMYANSHTGAEAGGVYAISHTHILPDRFVCDFSYFLNKCLIIQHFFKMYAISHT